MSKEYLLGHDNPTMQEKRTYGSSNSQATLEEVQWKFNEGTNMTIDYILVWDKLKEGKSTENHSEKRQMFENNLRRKGLKLEYENADDTDLCFVKIHAPLAVQKDYAERLTMRMPMKEKGETKEDIDSGKISSKDKNPHLLVAAATAQAVKPPTSYLEKIFGTNNVFPEYDRRITAVFSKHKGYLFDSEAPNYFTPAIRSRIVQFILERAKFGETKSCFGIDRLINIGVYSAAYPLHDGDLDAKNSMRYRFYHHWASYARWYRYQPIDHIRQYFGVKIALYFAWLGFYTYMLLPASVVGLACFLASLFLVPYDQPTQDSCSGTLDVHLCPSCDYSYCNYRNISETCSYKQIKFIFDNNITVIFAVFMSFWATIYLEMWKRYSAEITHRWDLTDFDTQEEQSRPQFIAKLRAKHGLKTEHKIPFWTRRLPSTIFSYSIVLLLVSLAIAAVIGVTLYRMSVLAALNVYGDPVVTSYAIIITTTTAATINLVCIFIFSKMYTCLAEYLTEMEMLRTQTEFDNSLTLKMYLLQFVNYYASIFYIAFCKGKLVGIPSKYNRIFGYRQEECGPGGCFLELSIQLAIIMVGKQSFNNCKEILQPIVKKWWNSKKLKRPETQWEKDYTLLEWGPQALFWEYLEMVLQYGFVTIFVSAFPLAPLFALLNNIMESRLDAKKLVTYHRRPVAQRVKDIGVWFNILDSVSKLAVITNGFIIAFTSDFVPRLVYKMSSKDYSLDGYMNHSLAYVDVHDLDMKGKPNSSLLYCRFNEYREPPWSPHKYEKTTMYWNVMAARFAFVVLFENLVVVLVLAVQWLIPDIPGKLREQIRREAYLTNEIIITQEAQRVCKRSTVSLDRSGTNSKEPTNLPAKSPDLVPDESRPQTMFSKEEIQDAAMIHRPQSFGEIVEESV